MKKLRLRIIAIGFVFCVFFCCCQTTKDAPSCYGFYHWKTKLKLHPNEKQFLHETGAQKLYVKYFDVDWDTHQQKAVPHALLQSEFSSGSDSLEIIPCVFITNRTMLELSNETVLDLAKQVARKIQSLHTDYFEQPIREIQLDCDWTKSSRANYFTFLKALRKYVDATTQLSATIRLHQVKYYERTQVPPVDKGMLMYYNMGALDALESENSIFDPTIAKQYLVNFDTYPLSLDLALPIFAWGVVYRDGKLVKLINNLRTARLIDNEHILQTQHNRFRVQKSTYLDGYYLYKGDLIRTESVTAEQLQQGVDLLKPHLRNPNVTISYYHLDTATIKHYTPSFLRTLW